jgi:hypothetical protein
MAKSGQGERRGEETDGQPDGRPAEREQTDLVLERRARVLLCDDGAGRDGKERQERGGDLHGVLTLRWGRCG